MCCPLKAAPVSSLANQAGLHMLEAPLIALQVPQDHAAEKEHLAYSLWLSNLP